MNKILYKEEVYAIQGAVFDVYRVYSVISKPQSLPFNIFVYFVCFVVQNPSLLSLAMFVYRVYIVIQNTKPCPLTFLCISGVSWFRIQVP